MCLVAERKGPAMRWIFSYSSTTRPAQGMHLQVRRTMSRREERRRQQIVTPPRPILIREVEGLRRSQRYVARIIQEGKALLRLRNLQVAGQPG